MFWILILAQVNAQQWTCPVENTSLPLERADNIFATMQCDNETYSLKLIKDDFRNGGFYIYLDGIRVDHTSCSATELTLGATVLELPDICSDINWIFVLFIVVFLALYGLITLYLLYFLVMACLRCFFEGYCQSEKDVPKANKYEVLSLELTDPPQPQ
jgi:hypothetical protein